MILAAAYLLWMFQRIVFGELSGFLRGLGDHLTDMTPVEILTLAPLGALVVIFGVFPGLLLDLIMGTVTETLAFGRAGTPIAVPQEVVIGGIGILVAGIVARIVYVAVSERAPPERSGLDPEGGVAR